MLHATSRIPRLTAHFVLWRPFQAEPRSLGSEALSNLSSPLVTSFKRAGRHGRMKMQLCYLQLSAAGSDPEASEQASV